MRLGCLEGIGLMSLSLVSLSSSDIGLFFSSVDRNLRLRGRILVFDLEGAIEEAASAAVPLAGAEVGACGCCNEVMLFTWEAVVGWEGCGGS
jgi:hypothetical protein